MKITKTQTNKERLIDEVGNILVSRVIERNDWISETIFDIAAGDKKQWTLSEWNAVLADLQCCKLKVSQWLQVS